MGEIAYKVIENIAVLREKNRKEETIELNLIQWGNQEEKIDIRKWDRKNDIPLKGICITKNEAETLYKALEVFL